MKKILLTSLFILLSSFVFAKKNVVVTSNDDDMTDTVVQQSSPLTFDWSRNDKNTDIILKIANTGGTSTVNVKSITLSVTDDDGKVRTCVKKTDLDMPIDPQFMQNINEPLPMGSCFNIRQRAVYSSATDPASARLAALQANKKAGKRKVYSRDVNIKLEYTNQGDSSVQTQNSNVGLLFTKSID